MPVTARVYVAVAPGATEAVVVPPDGAAIEKSAPVPLRFTVCVVPVVPLLLSVMVNVAAAEPVAAGV